MHQDSFNLRFMHRSQQILAHFIKKTRIRLQTFFHETICMYPHTALIDLQYLTTIRHTGYTQGEKRQCKRKNLVSFASDSLQFSFFMDQKTMLLGPHKKSNHITVYDIYFETKVR
jgi:hypothetical protein